MATRVPSEKDWLRHQEEGERRAALAEERDPDRWEETDAELRERMKAAIPLGGLGTTIGSSIFVGGPTSDLSSVDWVSGIVSGDAVEAADLSRRVDILEARSWAALMATRMELTLRPGEVFVLWLDQPL